MSDESDEQLQVWAIRPLDERPFMMVESWDGVREMIEDSEPEAVWAIKREWLTRAQLDALPEFDGW